ncbi:hypothetical protein K438DRAFT_2023368 [Mycena galopus ATCC 62051]|nr:hypothetical protein K438DRAFT_2023368 [Mycena galopus ATCC 62051]
MACSHALQITEIVRMICNEATPDSQTLLSLATTSRTLSDPALDVIWRKQTSLVSLVKCMPDTLWEERRIGAGVIVHLRRPVATSDLPRLLFYSVRVRILEMRYLNIKHEILHPEFLKALDMSLPQSFMPRLLHFSWTPKKDDVLSIMRHFLGPQIREIDLELGEHVANLSILPYIRSSCPLISEFCLGVETDAHSIPIFSEVVCGWQHLTDLSIPDLDEAGFTHVARLASLTRLSLCFAQDTTLYPPDFLSGLTFPALEYLFIRCETARFCGGVIQVISSRHFETLYIRPLASWTTGAWEELHATVRDCLNGSAFESIEVADWAEPTANIAPYVLSSAALRPLLAIPTLTSLSYQIYPNLDVDDDFLEEMARAWPEMGSLYFGTDVEVFQTQRSRATLNCLINFARHCRKLYGLGLHMDATGPVPDFSRTPGQRKFGYRLEALDVGVSPINSRKEAEVAAFISNLFPRLEYLFTFNSDPTPEAFRVHEKSWGRVSDMVPVFISVRSQAEAFGREELEEVLDSEGDSEEEAVGSDAESAESSSTVDDDNP